ncbi:MAG TPA: DUF882 domain-containing protein [Pseudolabrys sp.]|nr:DUF882 domain-containing protein [Pseudolabrys sp.]
MLFELSRERSLVVTLARVGARLSMAGLFLFGTNSVLQNAVAEGDTRTLSFHHTHTGEDITITFKRNGRYDDGALKKLDWFMRDWRREQQTRMDPHLFDLLWEAYRDVGGAEPIQVICGYRSPQTNSMLRARSGGVAQFSQHINGQAMDFFIPGVPLEKIREVGLRLQRGGVGFYPTSGSPFVHMDTGTIRHWPRMTHDQLARVFPDGRTVHIPTDGHPLRNYSLALAEVERRGGRPSEMSLEAARETGVITASAEQAAERPKRGFFERLFGVGKDADEANEDAAPAPAPAPKHERTRTAVASLAPPKVNPVAVELIVPMPMARPAAVATTAPAPAAAPVVTASAGNNLFANRGYWRGSVETGPDLPAVTAANSPFETASIAPRVNDSITALAYAREADAAAVERVRPMGSRLPLMPKEASVMPTQAQANTTVAEKPLAAAVASPGQRIDSPWLRAAMLTPSFSTYMTATRLGAVDLRPLQELLYKPSISVAMTFSADPHLGMLANYFEGPAVVFLATTTFKLQSTAFLQ